jgi:hypothetical protein
MASRLHLGGSYIDTIGELRERVLRLIALGHTSVEIARKLRYALRRGLLGTRT